MRKSLLFLFSAAFLCFFSLSSCTVENSTLGGSSSSSDPNNGNGGDPQPELCLEANGPVACYGRLKASGNKLIGSKVDSAVQLRGVSLGWSNPSWESGRFFTAAAVNAMVDGWKAEIIRVPMGCTANSCVNSTSALANANNLANNMNNVRT
ncbi:MAG: glycoside hydrolase family 5 protein, partial [Fibromonadales bacterium]|nr:glycoside hydrolase family 5 protein [Fibromonadales bacterium]